jgi:drug/metabolite transporter (DMT)-like permease
MVTLSTQSISRTSRLTSEGTNPDAFGQRDWAELVFAGVVWGASFIFIAAGVEHFSPGVVTFGRILIGCITLGLFRSARTVKIDREDWPRIIAVGISWLAFPMTLFPIAQQSISSGLAGMLNGSIPLFTAVVASIALQRLPGRNQRQGLIVGALGIVLLGIPALSDGGSSAVGVLLVVVACVSYGFASTINVPLAQKYGAIPTFWRAQLVATVLTAPYGLWGAANESSWDTEAALAVLVLGAFGTALAFVAMVSLSTRVGSTRAAALTYVEAIIALILGVIFRNEPLRTLEVLGCVVLLVGAWLVSRQDAPTAKVSGSS